MPDDLSAYLDPAPRRRGNYDDLIQKHAQRTGLNPELIRAVVGQESGGNPRAVSPKGAQGIGQLMPATAKRFGVTNPYDPDENLRGATDYLKFLNDRYGGNRDLTLAAYNAGEGAVDRYKGVPPYRETRNYVRSINARLGQQPQKPTGDLDSYLDSPSEQTPPPTSKLNTAPATSPAPATSAPTQSRRLSQPLTYSGTGRAFGEPATPQQREQIRAAIDAPTNAIRAGIADAERIQRIRKRNPQRTDQLSAEIQQRAAQSQPPVAPSRDQIEQQVRDQVREEIRARTGSYGAPTPIGMLHAITNPVSSLTGLFKSEDEKVNEETAARLQQMDLAQTPEVTSIRQEYGAMSPTRRALTSSVVGTGGGGLLKTAGGIASAFGIAPNRLSDWINKRADIIEAGAAGEPLGVDQREIERSIPEKVVKGVADLGVGLGEIVLLRKATNLPFNQLLALEAAARNNDKPLTEQLSRASEGYALGSVLEQNLSRPASAALFGVPTAAATGEQVAQGRMSPLDAAIQTGIQTGAGAVLGGKRESPMAARLRDIAATEPAPSQTEFRPVSRGGLRERMVQRAQTAEIPEVARVERGTESGVLREETPRVPTEPIESAMPQSRTTERPVQRMVQVEPRAKRGIEEYLDEPPAKVQPPVEAQRKTVESAGDIARVGSTEQAVSKTAPQAAQETPAADSTNAEIVSPQKFYHRDYGEVTESPNQRRVAKGRIRVIAEDGTEHVIKRAAMTGAGNQRAVPVREPAGEKPPTEVVVPSEDNHIGQNEAGDLLYERSDGSRYRIRTDRANRPAGYPDFGGDLAPVRKSQPSEQKAETENVGEVGGPGSSPPPASPEPVRESAPEPSTTAPKNVAMAADRAELGLPELQRSEPQSAQRVLDEAKSANERDPRSVDRLTTQALEGKKNFTNTETMQLNLRAQEIKNRVNQLTKEIYDEKDPSTISEKRTELDSLVNEFDRLSQAQRAAGKEWGRAGIARQRAIDQDFSLVSMVARFKAAAEREPTPTERARMEDLSRRNAELEAKLAEANDAIAKQRFQSEIERVSRRQRRTQSRAQVDDEWTQLKQQFAEIRQREASFFKSEEGAFDPEAVKLIGRMVRNRVQAGVTDAAQLLDDIHGIVGGDKRELRDAISGYSIAPKTTRSEIQKQIDSLKSELRQVSKTEDIAAGRLAPHQKGPQREFRRDVNRQRAIERQIADLEAQMNSGQFKQGGQREPPRYTRETYRLQQELDTVRAKYEKMKRDASTTRGEKALDLITRWKRFAVLSYPTTLGKLTTAATGRMVQTPAEEVIGGVLSKIPGISKIAARAPREGGISLTAEAKAVSQLWQSDSFRGIMDQLKSGRDMLDTLYGKKGEKEKGLLEFPGRTHGALKQIPKRAEFFRSFEKRLDHAKRSGQDLADPEVQLGAAMEAYNDARRSIFMQPNVVSDAFNQLMGSLARRGTGGKVLATLGRVEFPITRVPVNYVAEQTSLIPPIGIAKGIIRVVLSKGVSNLKPAEADYVLRAWKKAGIGMGMMALGYLRPQTFGGYYQPHDKRSDQEAQFGEVKLGQVHIPKWATHIPLIEAAQFGATVRRVQDEMAAKGAEHPVISGVGHASWELAKEVPFINQPERVIRAMESGDKTKAVGILAGQEARGMIPGFVQQVARSTDRTVQGENRTRRSQGFVDEVKQGIPGLRKTVPISSFFGAQARPSSDEAQRLNVRLVGVHMGPKETPAEFRQRQAAALPVMREALDSLVTSDAYKNLSDDDKRKRIRETMAQIGESFRPSENTGRRSRRTSRISRPGRESRATR